MSRLSEKTIILKYRQEDIRIDVLSTRINFYFFSLATLLIPLISTNTIIGTTFSVVTGFMSILLFFSWNKEKVKLKEINNLVELTDKENCTYEKESEPFREKFEKILLEKTYHIKKEYQRTTLIFKMENYLLSLIEDSAGLQISSIYQNGDIKLHNGESSIFMITEEFYKKIQEIEKNQLDSDSIPENHRKKYLNELSLLYKDINCDKTLEKSTNIFLKNKHN